jgi:hypothetical protein
MEGIIRVWVLGLCQLSDSWNEKDNVLVLYCKDYKGWGVVEIRVIVLKLHNVYRR